MNRPANGCGLIEVGRPKHGQVLDRTREVDGRRAAGPGMEGGDPASPRSPGGPRRRAGSAIIVASLPIARAVDASPPGGRWDPGLVDDVSTPRYASGANRQFSCTSRRQSAKRNSRVEKSRNGVVTGLRTLYTRSPTKNNTEMWVSTTAARSTKPMLRAPWGRTRGQRPQSRDAPFGTETGHDRAPGARIHRHPAPRTRSVTPDRQTGENCS